MAVPAALVACGGTGKAAADGSRVLKLWHYEGADSAMGRAEVVKQFQATHPGVTVEFEEKAFEIFALRLLHTKIVGIYRPHE
ncbi:MULTISPECIES: hypothetical protein [unclassified Streptosporangium]|uniref:hypothetical protein n=1 Tax=unclassified Streptosporangium TaxID=2632669 RepID=UPI002E282EFE|nr:MULTISPECIES: hypothetical protein [unclassified Streptosporangium]